MRVFRIGLALASLHLAARAVSGPLDAWQWRLPSPQGNNLNGITYGNGRFVAVGAYETVISSPDGTNWTLIRVGGPTNLQSVAWGNNVYVAVGERGLVLTSPDGIAWTRRAPVAMDLFSVEYGNDLFVAVGGTWGTNFIIVSVDGVNWMQRPLPAITPPTAPLKDVTYAASQFVAVAARQGIRSQYGLDWETNQMPPYVYELDAVAYGNGRFVATGPYTILSSTNNATSWASAANFVGHYNSGVAFGNGYFVIVGDNGVAGYSTNGHNWTGLPASQPALSDVAFGNNRFVAVGESGAIKYSTNATNWASLSVGPGIQLNDIAGGVSEVAVSDGYGIVRVSNDLENWRTVRTNTWLNRLVRLNSHYIGVNKGVITVSLPSGSWTNIVPPSTNYLWDIAFGKGTYVVSGYQGTMLTSSNAFEWTLQPPVSTNDGRRIAFGNEQFLTLSYGGDVAVSPDGSQWSFHRAVASAGGTTKLSFGHGVFVAISTSGIVADKGLVLTTRDGLAWSRQTLAADVYLHDITFANGVFLITAEGVTGAVLFDSRDGTNWTRRGIASLSSAYTCGRFGRTFLVSGWRGVLLQSGVFPMVWSDSRIFPQFVLDAHPGDYRIEAAETLGPGAVWDLVTNVSIRSPYRQWIGTNAPDRAKRFYRAVSP